MGLGAGAVAAIGAGVSAASGIAGSLLQKGAAQKGQDEALAAQQQALEQERADLEPWRTTGGQALGATADLLGLNGPDAATAAMARYQTSPGYQWQLGQGLRAVDAGAAAQGMLRSGATLKAEQTFGQGLADQDFGQYYARLANLSGQGLTAAGDLTSAGQQNANAVSTIDTGAANAQSSIYGNMAGGLQGTINNLLSNKDFQSWLNGGGSVVSPATVAANQLYQNQQFAANPGQTGPFW
jgi:hypothetical protein